MSNAEQKNMAQDKRAFSTSFVVRKGVGNKGSSAGSYIECLIARENDCGLWRIAPVRAAINRNESNPPGEKGVLVDGSTAYAMLKFFETTNDIEARRRGKVFGGTQYYPAMEAIARQARLEAAKHAGGKAMRVHLARRHSPKNL